ncbi:hypothetical protein N7G274_002653 [Stereocaulon virgatum]|uniref:Uncharacterized protein n=1 Tax=Stereocaulon virgatum TaxID=373712 RepID=A0ABR4AGF9_9LECA
MAPVTEIAITPLSTGADIEDPSSSARKVWRSTLDTVSQEDGFQGAYFLLRLRHLPTITFRSTNHLEETKLATDHVVVGNSKIQAWFSCSLDGILRSRTRSSSHTLATVPSPST